MNWVTHCFLCALDARGVNGVVVNHMTYEGETCQIFVVAGGRAERDDDEERWRKVEDIHILFLNIWS